ncbi:MAG: TetR/AcrR family transcriptional regulator [Eubacteriales bacterium]|nr:TetR/AcrR family transcriptional regulator [Eubacteriales bacterium]
MTGKTDLRIQKTHKALCETFLQLLSEKRFENITVNELCDRAMIRRATFYNHFSDKYDFFAFYVRQTREQFLIGSDQAELSLEPYAYNVFLFRQTVAFLTEHTLLVNSCMKSSLFPTLLQILSDEIYHSIMENLRQHAAVPKESLPFQASFYAGGIIQILYYWVKHQDTVSEEMLVHEFETIWQSLF